MMKQRKIFGSRLQAILLPALLLLVLLNFGGLSYLHEALSTRDYSTIPDPMSRVGYCMLSSMNVADKYLLAVTTAHPPDFGIYSKLMSLPEPARGRREVRVALGALKERDEVRHRAHRVSHAAAAACGFWQVKWPAGITPLDINLKWLRFDSTYSRFVERIHSEPDAAALSYGAGRAG